MSDHAKLIADLERASKRSRELDNRIEQLMSFPKPTNPDEVVGYPPHYTCSLDDALTLVPECSYVNLHIELLKKDCDRVCMTEVRIDDKTRFAGIAHTPALALCIAALKAREAGDGTP